MTSLFSESIDLLLPQLPEALAAPNPSSSLQQLARLMAPIPRGGFECRLGSDEAPVDLQQCIVAGDNEPALLSRYLVEATDPNDPIWSRVIAFLNQWSDPESTLCSKISEIWLEFDEPGAAVGLPLPSIFFALPTNLSARPDAFKIASQVLDLLLEPSGWLEWRLSLQRCFEACPEEVFVSHIGVMLSRTAQALRVNVKRLQPDLLSHYLQQVSWPGEIEDLHKLMTELAPQVDRITVCLDVGVKVYPKVGLECILQRQPQDETRWHTFLAYLVDQGWCTAAKREALLNWPETITPANAKAPWPEQLIEASLLQALEQFTSFLCRISHIKLTYHPQQSVDAKGYLWFSHEWVSPMATSQVQSPLVSPTQYEQKSFAYQQWNAPGLTHNEKIEAYFEATTELYLEHLGTTFQGWMASTIGDVAKSNVYLAERAGLKAGERILDAGCGVCGPAINIAQAWNTVAIDGITISPIQGRIGTQLIQQAQLTDRVQITVGDYHHLPWPDEYFDRVLFLESSSHSDRPQQLFAEVYRVLRPGGWLYIKDVFKRPANEISEAENRSMVEFDTLFVDQTRTVAQTEDILAELGFQTIQIQNLADVVSGERWREACVEIKAGEPQFTAFGLAHQAKFEIWPVLCGEIKAYKSL